MYAFIYHNWLTNEEMSQIDTKLLFLHLCLFQLFVCVKEWRMLRNKIFLKHSSHALCATLLTIPTLAKTLGYICLLYQIKFPGHKFPTPNEGC